LPAGQAKALMGQENDFNKSPANKPAKASH
jgi:hypothetical protein